MPFVSTSRRLGRVLRALLQGRFGVEGWKHYVPMDLSEGDGELSVKAALLNEQADAEERYNCLFQYFLRGFIAYASPGFDRVFYPGMGSVHGYRLSGLEGFARTAPLMAAWIASGRDPAPMDPLTHKPVGLVAILRKGLLAGTDPDGPSYWGEITDFDQRIVEAADIARVLWLTREQCLIAPPATINSRKTISNAGGFSIDLKALTTTMRGGSLTIFSGSIHCVQTSIEVLS